MPEMPEHLEKLRDAMTRHQPTAMNGLRGDIELGGATNTPSTWNGRGSGRANRRRPRSLMLPEEDEELRALTIDAAKLDVEAKKKRVEVEEENLTNARISGEILRLRLEKERHRM